MSDETRPVSMFDSSYASRPPWDIGRPQAAFVALEAAGEIRGTVLDVGCGTGEHVLFLRDRGYEAWGIDASQAAIAKAQAKAGARGVPPSVFQVGDALDLGALARTFDTVVDSGVFHVFSDADRARYVESLRAAVRVGGAYFTLVFSDREPAWGGPRRIAEADFARAFTGGWQVAYVKPAKFETTFDHHRAGSGGEAWLARVDRV